MARLPDALYTAIRRNRHGRDEALVPSRSAERSAWYTSKTKRDRAGVGWPRKIRGQITWVWEDTGEPVEDIYINKERTRDDL